MICNINALTTLYKIRKSNMLKLTTILAVTLLSVSALAENVSMFNIHYNDSSGTGVRSTEPFTTSEGRVTTVGEYRKELIEHTTRAVSLQFNHVVPHKLVLDFKAPSGYAALTSGPSFTEFSEYDRKDKFGFLEVGRSYPSTLVSALKSIKNSHDEDAVVSFADNVDDLRTNREHVYPPIVYSAYHEMMHVLGFVGTDCLGKCIPEPTSKKGHISPYLYYNDNGTVKAFESLSMTKKTHAYMSTDKLWFGGSETSRNAAMKELSAGHTNGFVYMFATPSVETGSVDPQAGNHFSFEVQPAQLMRSSRASTVDIGMAAYLLCDAGWCQRGGKVIEQSVKAVLNENASSDTESVIDITVSENLNVGVKEFELTIIPDAGMNVIEFQDPDGVCSERNGGYYCLGGLNPYEKMNARLIVTPSNEYTLKGDLRSTGFDVDRNGFNNILDVTLSKAAAPLPVQTAPVTSAPAKTENGGGGSGGGSMSFVMLPLLLVALIRRKHVVGKAAAGSK